MKKVTRFLVFILLIFFLCAAAQAQDLKLRLVILNPDVCVDSKVLAFEVLLTNEGSQPIAIYKSSLSEFAFTREKREQGKTTTQKFEDDKDTAADASAASKELPITIEPRSYLAIPFKYDVSGAYFYGGDSYSLRVGYRDIATRSAKNAFVGHEKSNVALFRRTGCE